MLREKQRRLLVEQLEDRLTPAIAGILSAGTLTITQSGVADAAAITITQTDTTIAVAQGASTLNFLTNTVTKINLLTKADFAGSVTVNDNGAAFDPSLSIFLGNGNNSVTFGGAANDFNQVTINGGSGASSINLANGAGILLASSLTLSLGTGSDTVGPSNVGFAVSGNVNWTGVNAFEDVASTYSVGGSFTINTANENATSSIVFDSSALTVGGNFSYSGGLGNDTLNLSGGAGATITGGAQINLGAGTNSTSVGASDFGRGINVTGTAGDDTYTDAAGAIYTGNISFSLGNGTNSATVLGSLGLPASNITTVTYSGGTGNDTFIYSATSGLQSVYLTANTGVSGNDTVNLSGGASALTLANITTGSGNDIVNVSNRSIGTVNVKTGGGNDTLTANTVTSIFGSLLADMGAGDDAINLDSSIIASALLKFGVGGTDSYSLTGAVITNLNVFYY